MSTTTNTQLQKLREALEAHRQTLRELDAALAQYEGTLPKEPSEEAVDGGGSNRAPQLLSTDEVCEALGMGKSWTYRKLKSGEIPSVKLGRSIKVKREELEEYLEKHRYSPTAADTDNTE
jgi:excisionase family DNA binding protein